eukprot:2572683-Rhodomonas_salina.1
MTHDVWPMRHLGCKCTHGCALLPPASNLLSDTNIITGKSPVAERYLLRPAPAPSYPTTHVVSTRGRLGRSAKASTRQGVGDTAGQYQTGHSRY